MEYIILARFRSFAKRGLAWYSQIMKILSGIVVEGKRRGRKLGFPTANIGISVSLESGVYAGKVNTGGRKYKAAIFVPERGNMVESYIFDFSGNIYGSTIEIEFERKIRDVRKFENEKDLVEQIRKDIKLIQKISR